MAVRELIMMGLGSQYVCCPSGILDGDQTLAQKA
jgi:hypothetical protein